MNKLDLDYQNLLKDILENGVKKETRNGGTISVFGRQIRHKMSEGFPLLTTKKMPWKSIVTELLWFLQGNTNIKWLVDNGCNIWNGDAYKNFENEFNKGNVAGIRLDDGTERVANIDEFIRRIKVDDEFAEKWGELGPIYGKQWRKWSGVIKKSISGTKLFSTGFTQIDQIQNLINDLKTNPDSRRLMVNAWNVGELDHMVLPPCHYGFQVYTRELSLEERATIWNNTHNPVGNIYTHNQYDENDIPARTISLMWNQRSVDTFLGLPFNIASYGLLLEIIAKEVNMVPDELIGNLGDVHLYSNHIEQAKEQIGRKYTHEERTELLKQAMGEENYNKAVDELMPFGGGLSEYFGKYNISPGLHTRKPFPLPTLKFSPCPITGIDMEYQSIAQFQIENYESHPVIKAPLSN
jgi:thymidylate synthase